ncbi:MAG: chorismate mutase [Candidatus Margulisiibacteriota bacterium]
MICRGIRGAITVAENTKTAIVAETKLLLETLVQENDIDSEAIASIFFTATQDLNAEFPAVAGRELGFVHVPLICMTEISVPGSLAQCIRVLIHLNTEKSQRDLVHVYLKGAAALRPDHAKPDQAQ